MISDDVSAIDALLEHGAEIDARDTNGQTCLHVAATFGTPTMVKTLASRGADVKAIDSESRTALHCAVDSINTDVYGALIRVGVDVEARNGRGQTALEIAKECELRHSVQFLTKLYDDILGRERRGR